jgi:hypothetical protein
MEPFEFEFGGAGAAVSTVPTAGAFARLGAMALFAACRVVHLAVAP